MRRTFFGELATIFAVAAIICYPLLRSFYENVPPLRYYTALPLAVLGVVEIVLARRVRAAVGHDPQARVMAAIVIARLVALGRASALASAAIAGAVVALLARVAPDASTVRAESSDLRAGTVVVVAAVFLLIAGLLLEASGIDPQRRDGGSPGRPVGNR